MAATRTPSNSATRLLSIMSVAAPSGCPSQDWRRHRQRWRNECLTRDVCMRCLALVERQRRLVELHDRQGLGSSIHRADAAPATAARPAAVAALLAAQEVERALAILAPGDGVAAARFGKQFTPALFAQHVHALRPVVLGVLIVPHAAAPQGAQVRVAVF